LQIGNRGEGFLTITNGGVVRGNHVIWSAEENTRDGAGYVTVDGAGSLLEAVTNLRVRVGTLDITNGGRAKGNWVSVGTVDHQARVTVSGANSRLESAGDMDLGNAGSGTLILSDRAVAEANGNIRVGYDNSNASGTVYVDETSTLRAGGDIWVGFSGRGLLAGTGYVFAGAGASGNIKVANATNNAQGILSAGNAVGEIGNLNLQANKLILDRGAVLRVDADAGSFDRINVNGNVEIAPSAFSPGQTVLTVDLGSLRAINNAAILQALNGGTITEASGFDYGSNVNFTLHGVDLDDIARLTSENVTLINTGASLNLTANLGAENKSLFWKGGNGWDWNMTEDNWRDPGDTNQEFFLTGDAVHFSGAEANASITGDAAASFMYVTNGRWVFSGDLVVDDRLWFHSTYLTLPGNHTSSLELIGSADVTLSGRNSFRNGIETASGSTLRLRNQNAAGTETIDNNGTLVLAFTNEDTWEGVFANSITGTGTLRKEGTGTATLTGGVNQANLEVAAGTLSLTNSPTVTGNVFVASGATLGLDTGTNPALSAGSVNAEQGALLNISSYAGTGRFTLIQTTGGITGDFIPYVGGVEYHPAGGRNQFMDIFMWKDGNELVLDQALAWNRANSAHGDFNIASGTFTLSEALADNTQAGAGDYHFWDGKSLIKSGAGTLTLTGANSYTGDTAIDAGTLAVAGTLGNGAYAGNIVNRGALVFDQNADQTLSGILSGDGSLTKSGAGILTLSNVNSFTGALSVKAGTLALGSGGSLAASALSLGAGALFDYFAASAYSAASPAALKDMFVNGLGAVIRPGAGGADFTGALLTFDIPSTAAADDVMLTVEGNADMRGAAVALDSSSGRPSLAEGEKVILLNVTGELANDFVTAEMQTSSGDRYTVLVEGNQLWALLDKISPTSPAYDRLKAFAESRAASLAFINQGQDLMLASGFGSALSATAGAGFTVGAFGGAGGGWSRYASGSHVDVSGSSFLTGLALGNDVASGRVTAGAFFEGGRGNYDSYNAFAGLASVAGGGDTSYYGAGFLGRYDVTQGRFSGLYAEASARMGRTETDFRSGDIRYNGVKAYFETSSRYYGLHGGLGYAFPLTDKAAIDLSAKVLWTRQGGDNVTVHQDDVRFEKADSLRTRLGGRVTYKANKRVTPYAGAYWEHEFAGTQRAAVNGRRVAPPSLRGDSGMAEIGLSFKPADNRNLSIDLGLSGYVGKREGVAGNVMLKWEF
jgi:outer membrane autotransporter protein